MGDSSSNTTPYVHELTSPLSLIPSDIPGISLVSVSFSGTGFGGWKRNMIVSLSAKNKIGFIDGSCTKPDETSPQYRQWDKCNNIVISWLTNSLSQDIAEIVQYSETTESIWKQLNNRYETVSGTKVFEIKRDPLTRDPQMLLPTLINLRNLGMSCRSCATVMLVLVLLKKVSEKKRKKIKFINF
uniref:Uncharacterized protein LOC104238545 n=1 Tax=Nicotiana sylvestris TaxID=4096 RepID=A0A1U7XK18_NICSY|nr:PREDICTED: uncharacterized protein LOC104238545 [Nicotiana sylvestris]